MKLPLTKKEHLTCIAKETARMSYPGSMSRGKKPVVCKGTKQELENYFTKILPINDIWEHPKTVAKSYENWHKDRVDELSQYLDGKISTHNVSESVAAKFLNTFMHQLMKNEDSRALYPYLHLPLDARVFKALKGVESEALTEIKRHLTISPYALKYEHHLEIQKALTNFVTELNQRYNAEFHMQSRIDLNWLWL